MEDNTAESDTLARLEALDTQVAHLQRMVRNLTEAVLDTAQASGYRLKHIKLARAAIELKCLRSDDWDVR